MSGKVPVALTIAGSDSSGGAGIQADLKTFTALGVYGTSVVTCVVAEHAGRVAGIQPVRPAMVAAQMETVFEAFEVGGAKTGMLFATPLIDAVCAGLRKRKAPLVVDPVMVASSGARLLRPGAVRALRDRLFPMATVLTPNLDEAALLLGEAIPNAAAMREAAWTLSKRFGTAVLLKGGHLGGDVALDVLVAGELVRVFEAPMVRGVNTHGSGCTLSAAVAAYLAKGFPLARAVAAAKAFLTRAVRTSRSVGKWRLLNHMA